MTQPQMDALNQMVQALQGEMQQVQAHLSQSAIELAQFQANVNTDNANTTAALADVKAQQVNDATVGNGLGATMATVLQRLTQLEQQAVGPSASGHSGKKKWDLTRPKDMEPEKFVGKDEAWLQWKEATEDYADAVHPGLKHAMGVAAKVGGQITDRSQLSGVMEEEWDLNSELFVLLKRKTTGEAKTLVTSADRDNGLESWRILVSRFEPQVGIKRMKEICDLMSLQNKRCKNPAETALILLEMGRRQKLIAEIGGKAVDNDTLVNVLWVSMDPGTRSHVSTKIDADGDVDFQVMREAVMRHTTLVGATSGSSANRSSAMDIGSIAQSLTPTSSSSNSRKEEEKHRPETGTAKAAGPQKREEEAGSKGSSTCSREKGKAKAGAGTAASKATTRPSAQTRHQREKGKGTSREKVKATSREKAREREVRAGVVGGTGTDGRTARKAKAKGMGNKTSGASILCAAYKRLEKAARATAVLSLQTGPQAQKQPSNQAFTNSRRRVRTLSRRRERRRRRSARLPKPKGPLRREEAATRGACRERKEKEDQQHIRQAMVPPPPQPTAQRPPKKTKRTYVPFACMPKPEN